MDLFVVWFVFITQYEYVCMCVYVCMLIYVSLVHRTLSWIGVIVLVIVICHC